MTARIRVASAADLPILPAIEVAAGAAFRDLGMDAVADDAVPTIDEFESRRQSGGLLVATDAHDRPIGYLAVRPLDGYGHVEQVSVHPGHAGQRIGAALIDAAELWAAGRGLAGLTLTTFGHVPWNAPYYERLGFRILAPDELSDGLRRVRADEAERGLDRWPRVAMVRHRPLSH